MTFILFCHTLGIWLTSSYLLTFGTFDIITKLATQKMWICSDSLVSLASLLIQQQQQHNYCFTALCLDYPGELVPEEILTTHHPDHHQLLPSTTIHSILPVQIMFLAIFLHNLSPYPIWSTSWPGAISSPNQCLLFATHAHAIATCFAVVSILYNLFLVFLSTPHLELYLLP